MKFETLKILVEKIKLSTLAKDDAGIHLQDTIEKAMIEKFLELLDIYEKDNQEPAGPQPSITVYPSPFDKIGCIENNDDLVPYHTLCSCNPANGGSGICGCVIANQMVPKNSRSPANRETFFTNMNITQNNNTEDDKNS